MGLQNQIQDIPSVESQRRAKPRQEPEEPLCHKETSNCGHLGTGLLAARTLNHNCMSSLTTPTRTVIAFGSWPFTPLFLTTSRAARNTMSVPPKEARQALLGKGVLE